MRIENNRKNTARRPARHRRPRHRQPGRRPEGRRASCQQAASTSLLRLNRQPPRLNAPASGVGHTVSPLGAWSVDGDAATPE